MSPKKKDLLAKRKPIRKNKKGRPREYDSDKLAHEMLEWSKDESSINMCGFCAERGYVGELIWRLEQECAYFAECYQIVKMRLAERRERFLNGDNLNYGTFQRYQGIYDPFLFKAEESALDRESDRRKGIVDQQQTNLVMLAQMAAKGKISQKD